MKEFKGYNQEDFFEDTYKIDIRQEIEKYLYYWRWFVFAICFAFVCAFLYMKYTPQQFSASAYIMIKDNLKSGISDELKAVSDLGIVGTSSTNNPENEIFIIKSRKIVGKMVDSLELNISYFKEGNINNIEAYKNSSVQIKFLNKDDVYHAIDTAFVVSFSNNERFYLKNTEGEVLQDVYFDEIIESKKLGQFKISRNNLNTELTEDDQEILVVIKPRKDVVSSYASRIQISEISEDSSILHLSIVDRNKFKAENILDELIKQYNLDAVIDKNIVSKKTKDFIDVRLKSVGVELGLIQDNLKDYKNDFGISGYSKESEMVLESISKTDGQIIQLKTQLSLVKWAQDEISAQSTEYEILPANLGFSDEITSKSIDDFNQLVLERFKLERIAGDKNPNLIALEKQIKVLKKNLESNLRNLKQSIEIQLNKASQESKKVQGRVAQFPSIERGIVDIQRQKIIYSELYSYLLRKKEEIAISLAVTVSNAKIIDAAFSAGIPVSPKKNFVYLIALAAGFLIPLSLIYIKFQLDTKIHYRKDIEDNVNIPYLGDIPNTDSTDKVIVKKGTRTSTAEAFRLLRTNLNFILPKNSKEPRGKTIFTTSTISGEGKSFVSINLAATLALTNKKVVLLGFDLRAPKITDYLEVADRKGITNYILDDQLTLNDIKFTIPELDNVDLIASGLIPPNPSELLLNDRVSELFEIVKKEYDFIIVDTAPISLVTDTLLIADYADMFLYVVRANHLDKRMLIVPNTLYKEKKLPNMAIVLNNTDAGRGYGYGYGYVEQEKKSFYKRVLGL